MDAFWGAFGGGLAAGLLVVFLARVTDRRTHRLSLYLDLIPALRSLNYYNDRISLLSELDRTASLAGKKIQNLWSSVSADIRKYQATDIRYRGAQKAGEEVDTDEVKKVLDSIRTSAETQLDDVQEELKRSLGTWQRDYMFWR